MKRTLKENNEKLIELWNNVHIRDFQDAQNTKFMARHCFESDDIFILNLNLETTVGIKYQKDGYKIFDYVTTKFQKPKKAYDELVNKIREKQRMEDK